MTDLQSLQARLQKIEDRINYMEKSKVSYKQFTWILGIIITIQIAMSGFIMSQISEVRNLQQKTSERVAEIWGKLVPFDIEYK